ncbi:TonB-dependent receptor [Parasphingopyxis algicola]|uniref:TonB-dependent receptor n=1 Tax=Parasphingopyxis algicola TaxID=2026624 RepID=UPI0015A46623|nr:TonB-dependent receptor [Parasphingopyxis algicola]QLC26419.1 TonB-dependent receptor [Parasphingopyxis algicola]
MRVLSGGLGKMLLGTTILVAPAQSLMAQNQPDSGAQASASSSAPIIVTAQRREQSLSEVPISIATLDSELLTETGVSDIAGTSNLVPNFNIYEGFDRSEVAINIRGLTSGTSNPGIDPSVGFFVDGVYIARPAALTGKLTDIERIEVLRGPQGTLYGRNTSAGAVNIYSQDPSDTFESSFLLGYGSYDTVDIRGRVSGPLTDGFGASLSGYYGRADSFLDDAVTGAPIGSSEDYGFRARLLIEPGPSLTIALSADYSEGTTDASRAIGAFQKDQGDLATIFQTAQQTGNPALVQFIRAVRNVPLDSFDRETLRSDEGEADDLEQYGVSAEINWDVGPATITSITAYRESEDFASIDPDFSPADLFLTSVRNEDHQFSQEIRLTSNDPIGGFEYLLGLFYFDSGFTADTQTQFGVPLFGQFNAMMPPNPITQPQSANSVVTQDTEAFAIFGQLSYEIVDGLTFTYGFRYNNESKSGLINQNPDRGINSTSGIPFPLQFPVFAGLTADIDDEDFINMASLNYQISPNSNIYATYAEGLKSGGINASILLNTNGLTFDKETSTNYEIGYRNVFANGMRLNLAAFYMTFNDLQVQTFDPSNPANIIVVNAGEAEIYGIEGDLFWPIADGLDFNIAAAYNESQYVDTVFPGTAPVQNPALPGIDLFLPTLIDVDGRTLSRAPKFTLSSGLQYSFALSDRLEASIRGDYVYASSQYLDAILTPESRIDGYGVFNLRTTIRTSDDRWQFSIFANNLFDEEYYTQIIASPAAAGLGVDPGVATFFGVQGAPQTFGVELRRTF